MGALCCTWKGERMFTWTGQACICRHWDREWPCLKDAEFGLFFSKPHNATFKKNNSEASKRGNLKTTFMQLLKGFQEFQRYKEEGGHKLLTTGLESAALRLISNAINDAHGGGLGWQDYFQQQCSTGSQLQGRTLSMQILTTLSSSLLQPLKGTISLSTALQLKPTLKYSSHNNNDFWISLNFPAFNFCSAALPYNNWYCLRFL